LRRDDALPDGIVPWNHPNLWKYMLHVDINHLRQKLEVIDTNTTSKLVSIYLFIF